ncbi:hypothetical protein CDCA_CDCA02G0788 [Cyanidium caldarium]|uniref:DNA repair metallo-beta-lactamase domain-containing protein n=1 Tax=Cyanidium caldarium TaxID=2771 RepID=A0AAV9IR80_CYACA|nr:hypothetical protein CDCA_CDCA02G0788 [Cyanidium caldarium]
MESSGGVATPNHDAVALAPSGGADAWVTRAWLRAAGVDSNLYGACFEAAGGVRVASLLELHRSHGLDEALMALGVTPLGTRRLLAAALERLEPHQGLPTSGGIGSGERDGQRKGSDRDGGLRKRARPDRSAQRTMTSLRPRSTPAPTPNTTPRRADESLGASLTAFVHQQVAKTEAVHLDSDFESTPTPTADAPATTTASASPTRPGTAASWPIAWKPASPHQPPPVAPMASTRTRRPTRPYTRPQRHAPSHCIAGAPGCVVDSFRVPCRDGDGWRHFFLTHFHADHYGGLSRRHFTPESGRRVYCSAITANCVQAELRLHESVLVRVPVGDARGLVIFEDGSCSCCPTTATATEVDTEKISSSSKDAAARPLLRVMACDANHCPGAVMFIFYVVATGQLVMHCGDMRYEAARMQCDPLLRSLAEAPSPPQRVHHLHIDTTYGDPRYDFVPQAAALQALVDTARRDAARGRTLFLCGTYLIGKERVWLALAAALHTKVYVSPEWRRKRRLLLECLTEDAAGESVYAPWLTEDAAAAQIHLVHMGDTDWKVLRRVYQQQRERENAYVQVVGVRATGWCHSAVSAATSGVQGMRPLVPHASLPLQRTVKHQGTCILYQLPYSEHSSFTELQAFVRWLRPTRIIPTVALRHRPSAATVLGVAACD